MLIFFETFEAQMPLLLLGVYELGSIEQCTGLERLDLSRNCIQSVSALAHLMNLTHLNLSSNQLTSLGS